MTQDFLCQGPAMTLHVNYNPLSVGALSGQNRRIEVQKVDYRYVQNGNEIYFVIYLSVEFFFLLTSHYYCFEG